MLRNWEPEDRHRKLRDCVAEMWGVNPPLVCAATRVGYVVRARQAGYWIVARIFPELSKTMIGQLYGARDHSTVCHGIGKIDDQREADPGFAAHLDAILAAIGTPPPPERRSLTEIAEIAQRRLPEFERGDDFARLFKKSADPDEVTRAIAADVADDGARLRIVS